MKLELRQEQRLSQRQIQSLHLLQMGWMELENTLSQLAEENPPPLISPPQMEGCMRLCRVTCSGKSRHYLSPRKKSKFCST